MVMGMTINLDTMETLTTFVVEFQIRDEHAHETNVQTVSFRATTTDEGDAVELAFSDLVELFTIDEAHKYDTKGVSVLHP